jgi:dipeptidyl aminopeptidase/acylaminoacyl peptidase
MSTYGFCEYAGEMTLICCYSQNGNWSLARKTLRSPAVSHEPAKTPLTTIATGYTQLSDIYCNGNSAWLVGAAPRIGSELTEYNVETEQLERITAVNALPFDKQYLSEPTDISFKPAENGLSQPDASVPQAHGFYYPPQNPDYNGEPDTLPPLIVICHGGPTGATSTALNLKLQYWTSRGFAVLDINYRGSTGYGRHYRQQLHGSWGVSDVADVVAGAKHLIEQQLVDPDKIAIRGSSAGGYTVLAALCFYDLFKAGACLYGIGDLETLAKDTHKFESRYLDTLIGPYPEQRPIYQQRSPIHHVDKLHCPVIFFQGLDDKVVPPEQALTMTQALRDKHLPVAYLPFEGEGHGFRKSETVKRALEAELYFYGKIFSFPTDKSLPEIHIDNLTL